MTPPVSPKFYEISNISFSHAVDPEEDIQTSIVEEKISFHPPQSFSYDSSIMNFVQSFSVIAQGADEKFDYSLLNDAIGIQRNDVLEEMSYLEIDSFTLTCPILPLNSYLITCTST